MTRNYKISKPRKHDPMTKSFQHNVDRVLAAQAAKGIPVARYDSVEKKVYYKYPDGTVKTQ